MKTKVQLAKECQLQIAKLKDEQDKLYAKALRTLKIKDTIEAWDWFFNDQQGHSSFLEGLK